jgi:hypothetical protein
MPKSKTWHLIYAIFNGFANTIVLPHALTIVAHFKNLFIKQHWDELHHTFRVKKLLTNWEKGNVNNIV